MAGELPWIEKYRPETLSQVVGQNDAVSRLQSYVKNKNVPNMLFSGPAGIGKTSAAVALSKDLYGQEFGRNFLELNASDARGIDVIRGQIKDFARTLAFSADFKITFLDESDALTSDAQHALRRTMEKYTKTCRFVLSCNYSSRIIEPLQSRCVVFRFRPLTAKDMEARIDEIAEKESLELDKKAKEAIVYVSMGDMRKAVNIMQAASALGKKVGEEDIFNVSSRARPQEVKQMIETALKGDFLEARKLLDALMYQHGMSGEDVISQVYREVMNADEKEVPSKTKIGLVDVIGEYDFRLVEGANERVQLEAMLAQFAKFKN
jgi:replication factor C small subunit